MVKTNTAKTAPFIDTDKISDVTIASKSGEKYSVPKEYAHEVTDEILDNFEKSVKEAKEGKADEPLPEEWIEE